MYYEAFGTTSKPQILLSPGSTRFALTMVVVTRKGQTTIPKELRDKYQLREGTKLEVVDAGDGILFRKAVSTIDLIGTGKGSLDDMKRQLDAIRREDV